MSPSLTNEMVDIPPDARTSAAPTRSVCKATLVRFLRTRRDGYPDMGLLWVLFLARGTSPQFEAYLDKLTADFLCSCTGKRTISGSTCRDCFKNV